MTRPAIIDWSVRDDVLPDIAPGEEYECAIAPQQFVVLRRIYTYGMTLVSLRIGEVEAVPFERISDDRQSDYALRGLDNADLRERLIATGAAVATADSIAIVPGLEVRVVLRNEGNVPAKPRAALIVQEEEDA